MAFEQIRRRLKIISPAETLKVTGPAIILKGAVPFFSAATKKQIAIVIGSRSFKDVLSILLSLHALFFLSQLTGND